ncbi:MAG: Glu/Leu/Phe/Val dehydrogenase dimerization domain-containing protein [Pseudomonadota bacterium]
MTDEGEFFDLLEDASVHCMHIVVDKPSGLVALIAVDGLHIGPVFGGVRTKTYPRVADAVDDVANLAQAMTLKCAIAGLPAGGAKTVILEDRITDRTAAFKALGRNIQNLRGLYHCAGDLGTTGTDLEIMSEVCDYVATLGSTLGVVTASTVMNGIRAALGVDRDGSLEGRVAAVQGCGLIGSGVARKLAEAQCEVILSDLDMDRAEQLAASLKARTAEPDAILTVDADILSPCAVGGVIDLDIVPHLKAKVICGGANNQLAAPEVARALMKADIRFVPDFLSSSGAVIIGVCKELGLGNPQPYLDQTYDTAKAIFARADETGQTPLAAAQTLARSQGVSVTPDLTIMES